MKGFICDISGLGSSFVTTWTAVSAAGAGVNAESFVIVPVILFEKQTCTYMTHDRYQKFKDDF